MVVFSPLVEAIKNKKGHIIFEVVSIGELKEGNGQNGAWKKKVVTIRDKTAEFKITLWNTDINEIDNGKKFFKLENPFWSEYEGKPQLGLGKFYKLFEPTNTEIDEFIGKKTVETTIDDHAKTSVDDSKFFEQAKETIKKKLAKSVDGDGIAEFQKQLEFTWAKEFFIRNWLKILEGKEPDNARVGMYLKLFNEYFIYTQSVP